jgi:hypothetical protein
MRKVLSGTFAAALLAVGVSAQTPSQNPPMQESKDAAKTLTVTGCLKAGDAPESFTLSDLKWKDDKAVGTTGATAPATPPVTATSLKLIPSASTKLSEHVGHTVEVTGTISDKAASGSSTPSDPAARPSAGAQTSASAQTALNVRNVRMVSATCTP